MKTVLVIGANSFIGKRVVRELAAEYCVIGTYCRRKGPAAQRQLDIADAQAVKAALAENKPDVVIVIAAVSDTSAPKEQLEPVNVTGVRNVADALAALRSSAKLVFFSSSQVFDGGKGAYAETDAPNPINEYGRSKLAGEKIVQGYPDHLILRCACVLGPKEPDDHDNFVTSFLKSAQRMTVFKDVFRSPAFVGDIGRVVRALLAKDARGIVHVSSGESLSYEEMAKRIERAFGVRKEYDAVACTNPNIPKNNNLSADRLRSLIGFPLTSFDGMLAAIRNGGEIS